MAKASLASMSDDALLKLRDDIGKVLSSKTNELKDQAFGRMSRRKSGERPAGTGA